MKDDERYEYYLLTVINRTMYLQYVFENIECFQEEAIPVKMECAFCSKKKEKSKRQAGAPAERIDCIPDNNKHQGSLEAECGRRQCIWDADPSHYDLPFCYIDK